MENKISQIAQIAFVVLMIIVLLALFISYLDYKNCLTINGEFCDGLKEIYLKWIDILGKTFASIIAFVFVEKGLQIYQHYLSNKKNNQ